MEDRAFFEKAKAIADEQEAKLQFDHFGAEDAWKLGSFMVEEMKARGISVLISMRRLNGQTVFQYAGEKASLNNEKWIDKKFNTTSRIGMSSLNVCIFYRMLGETLASMGLNFDQYIGCGGAFPIYVRGTGMVMVLLVSGMAHEEDHGFMVDCLSKYLGVEVPKIDFQVPMLIA